MSAAIDPETTRGVYNRQAQAFDAGRGRGLFEEGWLRRFADLLPAAPHVLDLGCGAGEPIAAWLMDQGFRVTGTDFADDMLALAQARWPDGDWRVADMRAFDAAEKFDGIIGWNSFFHLTPEEQRTCLPRLAQALRPGGVLMLTVGTFEGAVTGSVGAEKVYHASLSPCEYTTLLETNGLELRAFVAEDKTCNDHTVLLARRPL
jgi:trans-aconitate methyltransferase